MRRLIALICGLVLTAGAAAQDLGNQAPVKTPRSYPENIPDPVRQGGDSIPTATVIPALPYSDSGTTVGRVDDYDEICPYSGAMAPDVVYKYTTPVWGSVDIDLCPSQYDTKLYVYDAGLNLIACNDDYYTGGPCGIYVSKLESVPFVGGTTYYIIVDGYGNSSGSYTISVVPLTWWCPLPCPTDGVAEGEPSLVDNYVDTFNGGCFTDPDHPFQDLVADASGELVYCGETGWYLFDGANCRDTDWFTLRMGPSGAIAVTANAEFSAYAFELGPQDCGAVGVVQSITFGPQSESSMSIGGYAPGQVVWFWVGPTVFSAPTPYFDEYSYVVWFSGLEPGPVATEATTWSAVKALYH